MKPTQKQIAARLGISQPLVANVLNGKPGVWASEKTRGRIFKEAQRLGYRPNRAARALATRQTRTVAFWAAHLTTPFYASVLATFSRLVIESGYQLITHITDDPASVLEDLELASACDGVLALDMDGDPTRSVAVEQTALPVVYVGAHAPASAAASVTVDLAPGVRAGLDHVFESERRRVAYVASRSFCHEGEVRYREYHGAMKRRRLASEVVAFTGDDRAASRRALARHIAARGAPDAVFCQNDDVAMGAYRALRDEGLAIPGDVALLGCDGIEELEYFDPPIASIRTPVEEMCRRAWTMLVERIEEKRTQPTSAVLPAVYMPRRSVV